MALAITSIEPSEIVAYRRSYITLNGDGFNEDTIFMIGHSSATVYAFISETAVIIETRPIDEGHHDLVVEYEDKSESLTLPMAIEAVAELNTEIYDYMIRPIRDEDQKATQFGLRFVQQPQTHFDTMRERIDLLMSIVDSNLCPDDVVHHLLPIVGFTDDVMAGALATLSVKDTRKIIPLAVPMWRRKGSAQGIEQMLRAFTGKNVVIRDYFWWKSWLDGECLIGTEWGGADLCLVDDPGGPDHAEYTTDITVMDEDGTLNRELVLALLRLVRPSSERFSIRYIDLLDIFRWDLRNWIMSGAEWTGGDESYDGYIDTEKRRLILKPIPQSVIVPALAGLEVSNLAAISTARSGVWSDYRVSFKLCYKNPQWMPEWTPGGDIPTPDGGIVWDFVIGAYYNSEVLGTPLSEFDPSAGTGYMVRFWVDQFMNLGVNFQVIENATPTYSEDLVVPAGMKMDPLIDHVVTLDFMWDEGLSTTVCKVWVDDEFIGQIDNIALAARSEGTVYIATGKNTLLEIDAVELYQRPQAADYVNINE